MDKWTRANESKTFNFSVLWGLNQNFYADVSYEEILLSEMYDAFAYESVWRKEHICVQLF